MLKALDNEQRIVAIDQVLPQRRKRWNDGTEEGEKSLGKYHQALLEGLKWATLKPTNLSKVLNMKQYSDESP